MAQNELATTQNNAASIFDVTAYSDVSNETREGALTLATMLNAAVPLNGHEGQTFTIQHVLFKPGTRKGRNGMPDLDCTDTYIITTDGEVYFSQSNGVARSIKNLIFACGDVSGVTVKLDATTLSNGNTYKILTPVLN